jgi:hypothetical protein
MDGGVEAVVAPNRRSGKKIVVVVDGVNGGFLGWRKRRRSCQNRGHRPFQCQKMNRDRVVWREGQCQGQGLHEL